MIWKEIEINNSYSINEFGEVRNNKSGKIKRPYLNKANGYLYVDLYENNKSRKCPIHRLLAIAFIPNPLNKPTVDHKDGNRQNNSLDNLRWASYSEQNSRFKTVGVRSQKIKVTHYKEIRAIRGGGHKDWLNADNIMYFDRITDVAEYFNSCVSNISLLLRDGNIGKRGKTRGYKFEYFNSNRKTIHKSVTAIETKEDT